jgi:cbb3-type cytochrome oxidase subunit 3
MVKIDAANVLKSPKNITEGGMIVIRILDAISFVLSLFLISVLIYLYKFLKRKNSDNGKTTKANDSEKEVTISNKTKRD